MRYAGVQEGDVTQGMRFFDAQVQPIRVGLHLVGIVGLRRALKEVAEAGLSGREVVSRTLLERLGSDNFIPEDQEAEYLEAFWREHLRTRGEDVSPFFVRQPMEVLGDPGPRRDAFVATLEQVLAGFEMVPVLTFAPPEEEGPHPTLVIDGEVLLKGSPGRQGMWRVLRRRLTEW